MKHKIKVISALLLVMIGLTGIVAAVVADQLTATWTGTEIRAEAWDLKDAWYEIRFYAPGVLPDPFDESIVTTYNDPNDPTYPFYVGSKFAGSTCTLSSPCVRSYAPSPATVGDWIVVLMKDGTESNLNPTVQDSYRVHVSVNIPEFPTVALPVAAVIGLVFFFQRRKRKEE
jgi:hypothetical protein